MNMYLHNTVLYIEGLHGRVQYDIYGNGHDVCYLWDQFTMAESGAKALIVIVYPAGQTIYD